MKLGILSCSTRCYSTRRLREAAIQRGHKVKVLDTLKFAIDLKQVFSGFTLFTPMIAILIGFLPGCGPQVLVTTMYLAGILPLSAQIGNALSNDGDALFPAIAIAPKVAVVATLYSAVPAVIISYGWLFLFEW